MAKEAVKAAEKAPTVTVQPLLANVTIAERLGIANSNVPKLTMENPTKAARPKVKVTKEKARARARLWIPRASQQPLEKQALQLCLPKRRRGGWAPRHAGA